MQNQLTMQSTDLLRSGMVFGSVTKGWINAKLLVSFLTREWASVWISSSFRVQSSHWWPVNCCYLPPSRQVLSSGPKLADVRWRCSSVLGPIDQQRQKSGIRVGVMWIKAWPRVLDRWQEVVTGWITTVFSQKWCRRYRRRSLRSVQAKSQRRRRAVIFWLLKKLQDAGPRRALVWTESKNDVRDEMM